MLAVRDPRARGTSRSRERSRSRGGEVRDEPRARSRDIRAPSPARAPSPPRTTKSSRSKKYYEPDSDSEVLSDSEEEDDRRDARYRREDKYEPRSSRRGDVPPEDDYREDRRHARSAKDDRDRDYDPHHQRAGSYAYAHPNEYTQQMNYVKPGDDLAYGEHYSHTERKRHPSMNAPGAFPEDDDHDRPRHHQQKPLSPSSEQPPYMMTNVPGSRPQYQQPAQYRYAQPDPHLRYLPKNGGAQYTATPDAQIEVARRMSRREEEEEKQYKISRQAYYDDKKSKEKKKSRYEESDDDRHAKYREDHDDDRRKKKYKDDSDDDKRKKYRDDSDREIRKKKYKDDSDDNKKKKKYRDDSDDDKKKKKKYRDDSDDEKRKKKYRDDSDDDKKKKKYRDDSDSDDKKKKKYRDDSDDDKKKKKSKKHSDSEDERRKPKRRDSDQKQKSVKHDPRMVEIHPGAASLGAASLGAPALSGHMRRLSVSGHAPSTALTLMAPGAHGHAHAAGALPPGSPLLEAYHGTYQSISPMPSPMALASHMDDGMSDLEPLDGDSDDELAVAPRSILKKRVEIYDPEPDALAIAAELKHTKPGAGPLVQILPLLSDDNIMALRTEYKKHFKVNGKGINIAKHVKLKVPGNIGKAAYATALGRWESEAYWSNFWYQSNTSRRELLIESLIGRSNLEIRKIKEAFSDKRYNDSLEKCMQAELKKDKFRHAVLLALEEKRQDELEKLNKARIEADARDLYKALVAKDGGETAMIDIIVVRSDTHLRQVLTEFEQRYKANFARQMIAKSQNLVGETLAHILNGVLNRPVRDALLLRQAVNETAKDRAELLVSRLVRAHWEPRHLERIKIEYRRKYGSPLERDVANGTKGDFGEFCVALCAGATR